MASEMAGIAPYPAGGITQSIAQSFASVAEPPLPKMINLPPRSMRSRIAMVRGADFFRLLLRDARAQSRVIPYFHLDRGRNFSRARQKFPVFLAEKRIKKTRGSDVVAQFTMLEEDVHGFP